MRIISNWRSVTTVLRRLGPGLVTGAGSLMGHHALGTALKTAGWTGVVLMALAVVTMLATGF